MGKCALLEKARKSIEKTVSWFLWNCRKTIAHDTIQCLKNVVHYLNMKTPDILVGIIDLLICSSLKWDDV